LYEFEGHVVPYVHFLLFGLSFRSLD